MPVKSNNKKTKKAKKVDKLSQIINSNIDEFVGEDVKKPAKGSTTAGKEGKIAELYFDILHVYRGHSIEKILKF